MAFYGIDYYTILETMKNIESLSAQIIILVDVLKVIDGEVRILENFWNYIEAKKIASTAISIENFTDFAIEKGIQLPPHWPQPSLNSNQSRAITKESLKSKKPETLRKEIMARAAELARKFANRNSKPLPGPTALARNKKMQALVNIINEIGGLDIVEGDIDPEWLSPEDNKKAK